MDVRRMSEEAIQRRLEAIERIKKGLDGEAQDLKDELYLRAHPEHRSGSVKVKK